MTYCPGAHATARWSLPAVHLIYSSCVEHWHSIHRTVRIPCLTVEDPNIKVPDLYFKVVDPKLQVADLKAGAEIRRDPPSNLTPCWPPMYCRMRTMYPGGFYAITNVWVNPTAYIRVPRTTAILSVITDHPRTIIRIVSITSHVLQHPQPNLSAETNVHTWSHRLPVEHASHPGSRWVLSYSADKRLFKRIIYNANHILYQFLDINYSSQLPSQMPQQNITVQANTSTYW